MLIKKLDKIFLAGHKGLVGSAVHKKLKYCKFKNIITVDRKKLNLLDQKKTINFIKKTKPKVVILCAAKVGGIKANINFGADFIYENLQIQNNIIYSCFKSNVKKLIFLGSSCIYPKNIKRKIKESDLLTDSLEKSNEPYAIAKISGIKMCEAFNKQYKTNFLCLMPCNVFGPGDNYNLNNGHFISAILKKIYLNSKKNEKILKLWGTGKVKREVLFSEELSSAIIFFMKKRNVKHSLINIGSKHEMSIHSYTKKILSILKINMKIKFDKNKKLDGTFRKKLNTKLAESYGWKSRFSFKSAILKTYHEMIKDIDAKKNI